MTPELAIDIFKGVLVFSLTMVAPFLVVLLTVGLVTSLLQSITSIQEQTLTFAPKLIATAVVLIALGPWLLRSMTDYAAGMIARIATMGH